MFESQPFYHSTVRKLIITFGALFSNIRIQKWDGLGNQGDVQQTIKIPIDYGPSEKWIRRIQENSSISDNQKVRITAPRMSFELVDLSHDPSRQTPRIEKLKKVHDSENNTVQYQRVPYNFTFELNVLAKHINDGMQIVEQILPYFNPAFIVSIVDNDELGLVTDVPVVLTSVTAQDTWEGSFEESRILTWTLGFNVRAYLYHPSRAGSLTKKVIVNFATNTDHLAPTEVRITLEPDPVEAGPNDDYTITTTFDHFDEYQDPDDNSSSSSSSSSEESE